MINPDTFSSQAIAWMTAIGAILAPLTLLAGSIFGFLAYLKAKANELKLDNHTKRLDTQEGQITTKVTLPGK